MAIHTFGTSADPSHFVEIVDPIKPGQVKRPGSGVVLQVRDPDTLASLAGITTDAYGYWTKTYTDQPKIEVYNEVSGQWVLMWSREAQQQQWDKVPDSAEMTRLENLLTDYENTRQADDVGTSNAIDTGAQTQASLDSYLGANFVNDSNHDTKVTGVFNDTLSALRGATDGVYQARASLDADVTAHVDNGASALRASLDGKYATDTDVANLTPDNGNRPIGKDEAFIRPEDAGAAADGVTDDLAVIQARFNSAATFGLAVQMRGTYAVAGTLDLPAGVRVDMRGGSLKQLTADTTTVSAAAGAMIEGGTFTGLGTDYVAGSGATPTAIGVKAIGADVQVRGTTFVDHAGAAIYATSAATDVLLSDVVVDASGIAVGAGESNNFGIYIQGAVRPTIRGLTVTGAGIGVITGRASADADIADIRCYNIRGQHALYIQNASGLRVDGVTVRTVNMNGVKLQKASTDTEDDFGAVVANVNVTGAGDTALTINNTAADLSTATKFRGVTVTGVTAIDCLRALYLGSVRAGVVSNIVARNTTNDAFTVLDCHNIEGRSWVSDISGRVGLRLQSATGSSQDRVTLHGLRLHNAGDDGNASHVFGVYVAQGSHVTLDGLVVTADNGLMQYGLFVTGPVDLATFALRNADLSGDTGTSARFVNSGTVKEWTNNRMSGSVLNKPTGQDATVDVP